jgi:circadian clock protein KaiB
MSDNELKDSSEEFEKAIQDSQASRYTLRLFVAGNTEKSANAVHNLRDLCEEVLEGRYHLEVIDIYQQPELARGEQIVATPTLIKLLPPPIRRMIGDLSKKDSILVGLDLVKSE